MPRFVSAVLFVLFGAGAIPAHAAVTCVATPAQLATALAMAAENGQNDEIRLRRGTYTATQPAMFEYATANQEPFDFAMSGDWNSNCTQQGDDPLSTIIDGNQVSRALRISTISPGASVSVRLLTFLGGTATANGGSGGGLQISVVNSNEPSTITIERNAFLLNQADQSAGALQASGGAFQWIVNNVFVANTAQYSSAVHMQCRPIVGDIDQPGFGAFTNNTIVNNHYTDPDSWTVLVGCGGGAIVANNNFDGNSGDWDILFSRASGDPGTFILRNNNVNNESIADISEGNINVDPEYEAGFLDFLNFTPVRNSPLVDAGTEPVGILSFWYLTDFHLIALPRVIGPHVDIGAFENDRIFDDGFESPGPLRHAVRIR